MNFILPRDYSMGSIIENLVIELVKKVSNRTCDYDYRMVHALSLDHLRNKNLIDLTTQHLNDCKDCQQRNKDTLIFV